MGLRGEFHSVTWGTSGAYEAATGTRYSVSEHTGGLNFLVVLPFDVVPF